MSNRSLVILAVVVIVGTACWFCSQALWHAILAMHHRA